MQLGPEIDCSHRFIAKAKNAWGYASSLVKGLWHYKYWEDVHIAMS
jgi:hypothetical protein